MSRLAFIRQEFAEEAMRIYREHQEHGGYTPEETIEVISGEGEATTLSRVSVDWNGVDCAASRRGHRDRHVLFEGIGAEGCSCLESGGLLTHARGIRRGSQLGPPELCRLVIDRSRRVGGRG